MAALLKRFSKSDVKVKVKARSEKFWQFYDDIISAHIFVTERATNGTRFFHFAVSPVFFQNLVNTIG